MRKITQVKHIMVLVDGTETSAAAATLAIELAHQLRARLTALAVVETETLHELLHVRILSHQEMQEFEGDLMGSARKQVADVRERAAGRGIIVDEVIATGNSEMVVPREVEKRGVDLIAVGAFHTSRAMGDLLVRQRQQIVDNAPCAVLVAR